MLAVLLVVTSVFWKVALDAGLTLYLVPRDVLTGQVWQLVTWLPAEAPQTGSVLFGALIIWSTGGSLELRWGRRRFLLFAGITVFLSGLLALGTVTLIPALGGAYFGGSVLAAVVWVGYGCAIWNQQTNIFSYPLTGRTFAMIGVLLCSLNTVFSGPHMLVAEIWGLLITFAYAKFGFPGEFWLRFRSWQLQRDLDKRSAHLRSIDGGQRNVGRDSDKYLH